MNTPTLCPHPRFLVSTGRLAVLFVILALAIMPAPAQAVSVAGAAPLATSAATLIVTRTDDPAPDGCMPTDCSLREAILAAAPAEAPTVTLSAGTYTLSRGALTISHDLKLTGTLSATTIIDGGRLDRVLTITSVPVAISDMTIRNGTVGLAGGGIYNQGDLTLTRAIVSGNTAHNVEEHSPNGGGIVNTGTMTIEGSLIRDNQADGSDSGGGAIVNSGTLTVRHSRIQNNSAYLGGGILNMGTLNIVSSDILSNTANQEGGGILNNANSVVSLKNVTLVNNFATADGGAVENDGTMYLEASSVLRNGSLVFGGAFDNQGALTLVNSIVDGNFVSEGSGGGFFNTGMLTVSNSQVILNRSDNNGGGILNSGGTVQISSSLVASNHALISDIDSDGGTAGIVSTGTLTLTSSTVADNLGERAGGIENSGTMTLRNSTISGNQGRGSGGGLMNSGMLSLVNVTVSGNRTKLDGGGIQNHGTLKLLNATIANNVADDDANSSGQGGGIANIAGTIGVTNTVLADNRLASTQASDCTGMLISYGHNAIGSASGCMVSGISVGNQIGVDPALDQLAQNGGPTLTHALLPGSTLIDAADSTACLASDQRGFSRPSDGDHDGVAVCDIGAFELHIPYRIYLSTIAR